MHAVPLIRNEGTFLQEGYVGETFGYQVRWYTNTQEMLISLAGNLPESNSKFVSVKIAAIHRSPEDYAGKEITIRGKVTILGTHVRKWYAPPSPQIPGLPPTSIGPERPIASKYIDFIQIDDGSGAIRAEFENKEEPMGAFTDPPYGLKVYRGEKVELTGIVMKNEKKGVWIEEIRAKRVRHE